MISEWFLFGFSAWNDCKCERVQCIEGKKNTLCSFVAYRNVQCLPFCSGSFFKINAMVIENGVSLIYVLKYVLPFQTSLHTTVVRPQLLRQLYGVSELYGLRVSFPPDVSFSDNNKNGDNGSPNTTRTDNHDNKLVNCFTRFRHFCLCLLAVALTFFFTAT